MSGQKKFDIFPVFSAVKWRPTSYKMMPYELKNGAQYCFSGFVNRLFRFIFLCESSFHFTSFFHCLSFPQVKSAAGIILPCLSQDQKCPEMNMHLDVDLNLDAFWYFDGLGYYNFCLPIFGSDWIIRFCTSSQRSVQIGVCRFWYWKIWFARVLPVHGDCTLGLFKCWALTMTFEKSLLFKESCHQSHKIILDLHWSSAFSWSIIVVACIQECIH